jgi:hypothetical protein
MVDGAFDSGLSVAVLTQLIRMQSATILLIRGNLHLETIQLGELHIYKESKSDSQEALMVVKMDQKL